MFHIRGVIEGFYGTPWGFNNRFRLLEWMRRFKLNSFVYAPKFDPFHRLQWRLPYPAEFMEQFAQLVNMGRGLSIDVIPALSPGLTYHHQGSRSGDDYQCLKSKFRQFAKCGADSFTLLLDDIPLSPDHAEHHAKLANRLRGDINDESRWFVCPTVYSGWHLHQSTDAAEYLARFGEVLDPAIRVLWTGPSVISKSIDSGDIRSIRKYFAHPIVIWDNFSADDYVPGSTVFTGPVMARDPSLHHVTDGILLNPSQWFELSLLPIASLGVYSHAPAEYEPHDVWAAVLADRFGSQSDLVSDLMGYFYTPLSPSPQWQDRLKAFSDSIRSQQADNALVMEFLELDRQLGDDRIILHNAGFWNEAFPFLRTLRGDLEYALRVMDQLPTVQLPYRDPRWITPIFREVLQNFCPPDTSPA